MRVFVKQEELVRLQDNSKVLAFLLQQFQVHSPKMDGQHSWRFRTGWPWTHAKGPTIEKAVRAAMEEVLNHSLTTDTDSEQC